MISNKSRMERMLVNSSCILLIGYSVADQLLEVQFRSGAVYRYFAVPFEVHASLAAAESKGAALNRLIKGKFSYVRLPGKDLTQ